jgi:RNA polymerase sigma factor (sigma-70 family)
MDVEAQQACADMERYCDGEAAAFHRLYAQLAPRVLAYLTGMLADRAAAEDVLQLAFMKVHESRSAYIRGANPIPWIYTIAHRTCLDALRKRKRSRVRLSPDGQLRGGAVAHITGGAEDAQEDGSPPAAAAEALAALEQLPDNQRQAIILTKVHGRTIVEAALITGSSPGAIKQRAHRAYVTLRQLLHRSDREAATSKELT